MYIFFIECQILKRQIISALQRNGYIDTLVKFIIRLKLKNITFFLT